MKTKNYRNFACVIGLAVGLSLIGAASSAQAAEYLLDENGVVQYDENGAPIMVDETFVISGTTQTSVVDRLRTENTATSFEQDFAARVRDESRADFLEQNMPRRTAVEDAALTEDDEEKVPTWFFADAGV